MNKIGTAGLHFTDELGRIRFFNGMNIDDKTEGDVFRYPLDDAFFKAYSENGFNLIRLAVQWANIEPQSSHYSESYLKSLDDIFRTAEKYNVYILLDMHQDLYSGFKGIGGGDGAPEWACLTDGSAPKPYKFVWAEAYVFGKWVKRSFDHFWQNDKVHNKGLLDHYADLWRMMAERYGNFPALFGFDFLNEPFPGSFAVKMVKRLVASGARQILFSKKINRTALISALIHKDPKALLDGIPGSIIRDVMSKADALEAEFDRKTYGPFLNKMAAAVREKTRNGILMIEQPFLCNGGVKLSVEPITVNGKKEPLQCFGPHAYDMTVDTPLYKYANADRVKTFFGEMRLSQLRLQIPAVVGEWGGCSDNTDTSWFPHAYELLDYFDGNGWGQLYWDYHGDDMTAPLMQMLSRTCPVAVAGEDIHYRMDREKKIFTLEFTSNKEGETLIYAHAPSTAQTDGEVKTVSSYSNGASLLSITCGNGKHTLTLQF